jgi:cytochrome c-type biogenesis protein CcmH
MKSCIAHIVIIFILGLMPIGSLLCAEDYYHFTSSQNETRFSALTNELRCLVCQNQNLAESNAPLASDLRQQIYNKIESGQSNQEIIDYLVTRYSSFILYKPPFNFATIVLWFGPISILLASIAYLLYYLKKNSQRDNSDVPNL